VQRVSGAFYGRRYFPQLAGVGYSFNPFVWNRRIDPQAGVLRLVFGLGTRAVDGHGDDYTRIVALNAPLLRPAQNDAEARRYTQRIMDVLDLEHNRLASLEFEEVARDCPELPLAVFASRESEQEARVHLAATTGTAAFPWVLTFDTLLTHTGFAESLRLLLKTLAAAYEHPVDIEFTANFLSEKDFRINVVQCRPFQCTPEIRAVTEPAAVAGADVLLRTRGPIIGQGVCRPIGRIVHVSPAAYGHMAMADRYSVARLMGELTRGGTREDGGVFLIGPGRWGTKMASLGIPVSFPEIRHAAVLCEVVAMHEGLTPDLSLGTHFFNDLVEMEIVYLALFPGKSGYALDEEALQRAPNRLLELAPAAGRFAQAVRVVEARDLRPGAQLCLSVDPLRQEALLFFAAAGAGRDGES
jgi:hypothetical protein